MEFEWKGPRNRRRSRCRKTVQPDRLSAEAARASLEIWNRVAGFEQRGIKVVSYRCRRCGELHVGRRREVVEPVQQNRDLNDSGDEVCEALLFLTAVQTTDPQKPDAVRD